ncbi:thioredoxin-like isoform X1 [Ptychodera flava]|uniref:thioredoxin-like isoform X1 n=1 Tax=Ptychodera flava TaxID=63121 RepID=UPI00396A6E8B
MLFISPTLQRDSENETNKMSVRTIYEQAELNDIKNNIGDRVLVMMISAWWHERSEDFIPTYKALAREFRALNFIKTDIAASPGIAANYEINQLPSFLFFRNSNEMRGNRIEGLDEKTLRCTLERLDKL